MSNTPLAVIEEMQRLRAKVGDVGAGELMGWLLDDAQRLNRLEARVIEAGFEDLDAAVDALLSSADGRWP